MELFRPRVAVAFVGLLAGCAQGVSTERPSEPSALTPDQNQSAEPKTVKEAIELGGVTAEPPAEHDAEPIGAARQTFTTDSTGTNWQCDEQKMNQQSNPPFFTGGNGMSEVIYPGAVLQGKTLNDDPQSIPVKRSGGKIYSNATNGTTDTSETLEEVTPSLAQSAQNAIVNKLNEYGGAVQDPPSLDIETFDSLSELQANLKVGARLLGGQVGVEVGTSNSDRKSRVMVLLRQRYYRLVFEPPASDAAGFFHRSVTPKDLQRYIQPGNPAVYVSSVTYGRLLYVLFESDVSKSELRTAVSASFGPVSGGVSADVAKTRSSTRIKIFPVGGATGADSGSGLLTGLTGDSAFAALQPYIDAQIRAGSTFDKNNPAAAIEYTVKDLQTRATVKQNLGIEYTKKDCRAVIESKSAKMWLDANDISAVDAQNNVQAWPAKTTTQSGAQLNAPTRFCAVKKDATIGGLPAIRFTDVYGGGIRGLSCDFAAGRNYTLAAVVGGDGGQANATLLASLKGNADGQWLRFGPNNNNEWYLDHRNVGQRVFSYDASGGPKLVVTTFEPGARTWVNGVEKTVLRASSNDTQYFSGNTSCSLGVPAQSSDDCGAVQNANRDSTRNGWGTADKKEPDLGRAPNFAIGEVIGFDRALRQAERRALECELAHKWNIAVDNCVGGLPTERY